MKTIFGVIGTAIAMVIAIHFFAWMFGLVKPMGYFVDPNRAVTAMSDSGFTSVSIKDSDVWFAGWKGCGDSDAMLVEVSALNPNNKAVDMFVCLGLLKGSTIRSE